MNDLSSEDARDQLLRVALVGYGKMGHEIERLAATQSADIVARFDSRTPLGSPSEPFDVAIEFTRPDAVVANIASLVALGSAVVVGTTGWGERMEEVEQIVREGNGRLIWASNFSVGVNIFYRILLDAARLFDRQPMYDVSLHEIHHVRKADSPSGTALELARILLEGIARKTELLLDRPSGAIDPAALHVSSQRLGSVVGTHGVTFDSEADSIELVHRAKNRQGFALGALMAARWIVRQPPGVYRFDQMLDS